MFPHGYRKEKVMVDRHIDQDLEQVIEDSPVYMQDILRSIIWGNKYFKPTFRDLPEEGMIHWDATLGDSLDELL